MKFRERIADVEYEISKEQNKILGLEDILQDRIKQKEENTKQKFPWTYTNQLGLEQTELQIKIHEATMNKLVNEIKYLRLELQELLDKKSSS